MSLKVWLPLTGDLHNQGLSDVNLTASANSSISQSGKIGSCYQFGTSTSSYLKFNDVNFIKDFKECSVSLWIKILTWNTSYSTYFQFGFSGVNWAHYIFGLLRNSTGSTLCFTISNGSSATNANCLTPSLELNKWYHITLTYKSGHCKIYINGQMTKDYSTSIVPDFSKVAFGTIGAGGPSGGSYQSNSQINDFRIYDHCLSQKEIKEISKGLIVHYPLDSIGIRSGNPNLGNTSANYSNQTFEYSYTASSWGGDTGTVTYYSSGGYNNLPYKVYHKTATGSGGIYRKTDNDIIIEEGKTYTFSCWIKSSVNYTESAYGFNINRGAGNYYINIGTSIALTTEWQLFKKTFTATTEQAGSYGEMSIIYNDNINDYYVYYSGFKIEEGTEVTEWVNPIYNEQSIIYDTSGFSNNASVIGTVELVTDTPRYIIATHMNNTRTANHIEAEPLGISDNIFTVSFWVKSAKSTNQVFFADPKMVIGTLNSLIYINPSTALGFTTTNFIDNEWNHIAAIRNESTFSLYINGVQETTSSGGNYYTHNASKLYLFNRSYNNNYAANAYMSDLRVYTTALTEEDILELYQASQSVDNKGNLYSYEYYEED